MFQCRDWSAGHSCPLPHLVCPCEAAFSSFLAPQSGSLEASTKVSVSSRQRHSLVAEETGGLWHTLQSVRCVGQNYARPKFQMVSCRFPLIHHPNLRSFRATSRQKQLTDLCCHPQRKRRMGWFSNESCRMAWNFIYADFHGETTETSHFLVNGEC